MTVAQVDVIDWMGIEKGTGSVVLTVVDDLDWADEENHLLLLQTKLNTYLAFIESGEVFERLVEELGRRVPATTPVNVAILAKYDLTERPRAFVEHACEALRGAGFSLSHRVVRTP